MSHVRSIFRPVARLGAVRRARFGVKTSRSIIRAESASEQPPSGAFVRGQAQFSRFYPQEARDFTYSRHIMLAVDGTHASEDAARWCMQNVTRSGDLLHLIHVATPETLNLFSISGPPGTEFVMDVDWERRDQFWESVVRRTERLLDGTITNIIGKDASESNENFIRPPIELDAILDQTWTPVGEVLLKKANECGAEMIVVIKHHKTWLERTLTGSVSEFVIDQAKQAVVVYHAEMPTSDDVISDEESSQSDAEARNEPR